MARRDKPRLEWDGATAYLSTRTKYSRYGADTRFARVRHDPVALTYWVLTNDFDTTRAFETYEGARGYILALYALID